MLTIRLQRIGKAKKPSYRLIINENARDTQAKALEILGHYAPTQNPKVLELKTDRIEYWLEKGAKASETVHNLLVKEGIIKADKKKSVTITNKRAAKLEEKKAEEAEKQKAAEEEKKAAKDAAAAEAKAQEESAAESEAPAEEAAPATEEAPAETPAEDAPSEEKKEEAPAEEEKPAE